jgi:hypothetical protein
MNWLFICAILACKSGEYLKKGNKNGREDKGDNRWDFLLKKRGPADGLTLER